MTHNHIRDTMANLLREVCHDVKVEPQLQKVNEGDYLNPNTITGDQVKVKYNWLEHPPSEQKVQGSNPSVT